MQVETMVESSAMQYQIIFYSDKPNDQGAGPALSVAIGNFGAFGPFDDPTVIAHFDAAFNAMAAAMLPNYPGATAYTVRRYYLVASAQTEPVDVTETEE
jgi:hypothetical protein